MRVFILLITILILNSCKVNQISQNCIRWNHLYRVGLFNPMILQELVEKDKIRSIHIVNSHDTIIKGFLSFDDYGHLTCVKGQRDSTIFYYKKQNLIAIKSPYNPCEPDSFSIKYKSGNPYEIENYMNNKLHSFSNIIISDNTIQILRYFNLEENQLWRLDSYIHDKKMLIAEVHQKFENNNIIKKYKYENRLLKSDSWISGNTRITTIYDTIGRPIKKTESNINDFKTYWTYEYRYFKDDLFPSEKIITNGDGKSEIMYYHIQR